jgi:sugar phosphate isomerase/epimerase
MKAVNIGVQAMTVKEQFASLGAYETMSKLADIGYRSVEISQIPTTPENIDAMRRAQDEKGIKVAAMSAGISPPPMGGESIATHFSKIVNDLKALDCHFLRIGMLPFDSMASLEAVLGFCKSAEVAAKKLQDHGIKLYYHNHHVEFMKFDGKRLLNIIADEAPSLGMELDVHWIQRGGANPVEVIKEFSGRADLIHLKDYRIGAIEPAAFDALAKGDFKTFMEAFQNVVQFAEVGEGNIDMPAVIEAGLAGGAKYFFIEQDNLYGRDAFDCLITSRDNLAKMGYSLS